MIIEMIELIIVGVLMILAFPILLVFISFIIYCLRGGR